MFLLAVHMLGGMRLLLIENMPWRDGQKNSPSAALAIACIAALAFLVRAI